MAESLSVWKENDVQSRSRGGPFRSNVATIGWNNSPVGKDTTKARAPARYTITVPDSLRNAWQVGRASTVLLTVGSTDQSAGPRKTGRDTTAKADSAKTDSSAKQPAAKKPAPPKTKPPKDSTPPDFTVELEDSAGHVARLPLSAFGTVRRPLEAYIYRRAGKDKANFPTLAEPVMQTYLLPTAKFVDANSAFDPATLRAVRLVFDRTRTGVIMLDDVGVTSPR